MLVGYQQGPMREPDDALRIRKTSEHPPSPRAACNGSALRPHRFGPGVPAGRLTDRVLFDRADGPDRPAHQRTSEYDHVGPVLIDAGVGQGDRSICLAECRGYATA